MIYNYTFDSIIGKINLCADDEALTKLGFGNGSGNNPNGIILEAVKQLNEYFDGKRQSFDLPLKPHGTEFQQKVWSALLEIPYGQTRTYGEIAAAIGNPKACRAVGMANNRNPIAVIIPCHRVIGSNGALTGYAGGLKAKEILLELENNRG